MPEDDLSKVSDSAVIRYCQRVLGVFVALPESMRLADCAVLYCEAAETTVAAVKTLILTPTVRLGLEMRCRAVIAAGHVVVVKGGRVASIVTIQRHRAIQRLLKNPDLPGRPKAAA